MVVSMTSFEQQIQSVKLCTCYYSLKIWHQSDKKATQMSASILRDFGTSEKNLRGCKCKHLVWTNLHLNWTISSCTQSYQSLWMCLECLVLVMIQVVPPLQGDGVNQAITVRELGLLAGEDGRSIITGAYGGLSPWQHQTCTGATCVWIQDWVGEPAAMYQGKGRGQGEVKEIQVYTLVLSAHLGWYCNHFNKPRPTLMNRNVSRFRLSHPGVKWVIIEGRKGHWVVQKTIEYTKKPFGIYQKAKWWVYPKGHWVYQKDHWVYQKSTEYTKKTIEYTKKVIEYTKKTVGYPKKNFTKKATEYTKNTIGYTKKAIEYIPKRSLSRSS